MLLTELNTKALLEIFKYLDLVNSINLAETCVHLQEVAQIHYERYKIFNLNNFLIDEAEVERHNDIDAETVLSHIGSFISVLLADLDESNNGLDLSKSIQKYCVNVKTLKFNNAYGSLYSEWITNLNLESITFSCMAPLLYNVCSGITTLKELVIDSAHLDCRVPHLINNILKQNLSISTLYIPLGHNFNYEIFAELKNLKCLGLFDVHMTYLVKVAANLKMNELTKFEARFQDNNRINEFDMFLKTLAENAKLNDLAIKINSDYSMFLENPLHSLNLFNLTSLNLNIRCEAIYNVLPQLQPNVQHLNLVIYDLDSNSGSDDSTENSTIEPLEKIIFIIKHMKKLEIFHIKIKDEWNTQSVLKALRDHLIIQRILDACSNNRPTLRLYVRYLADDDLYYKNVNFLEVKLLFNANKYKIFEVLSKNNYLSNSLKHQSLLPCCY